jgi:AcrR family transcriptional regulator
VPKVVDHEGRREDIAEALLRLVERDGVERVSLRAVAAEAGWSTGVLAHYFGDKDELLTFAFERVHRNGAERAERRVAAAPSPAAAVRALLAEALPLDATRRREARLWFAYLERARTDAAMAEVVRRHYRLWSERLEAALTTAGLDGPAAHDGALELLALVDGLTVQALAAPRRLPATTQERALDASLRRLLTPGG